MVSYAGFLDSLTPSILQIPGGVKKNLQGMAYLGQRSDEDLMTTPLHAILRMDPGSISSPTRALGLANALNKYIQTEDTGRTIPADQIARNLNTFTVPGFNSTENSNLMRFLNMTFIVNLSEEQKKKLLAGAAKYSKLLNAEGRTSLLSKFPKALWSVITDLATAPEKVLKDLMTGFDTMLGPTLKKWAPLLIGGMILWFFLPQITGKVVKSTRAGVKGWQGV